MNKKSLLESMQFAMRTKGRYCYTIQTNTTCVTNRNYMV